MRDRDPTFLSFSLLFHGLAFCLGSVQMESVGSRGEPVWVELAVATPQPRLSSTRPPPGAWEEVRQKPSSASAARVAGNALAPQGTSLEGAATAPQLLYEPEWIYPADAEARGEEGDVWVEIEVDESGRVVRTQVRSPAHPALVDAALEAARQMRFSPARREGRAVAVRLVRLWRFRLEDTP